MVLEVADQNLRLDPILRLDLRGNVTESDAFELYNIYNSVQSVYISIIQLVFSALINVGFLL